MNHFTAKYRVSPIAARDRGYSMLELTLAITAVAVIAVIVFLAFSDTQSTLNQTRALSEINAVAASARQYRSKFAQGGLYTNIAMDDLENKGYSLGGMQVQGTNAVNAYGLNASIVPTGTPPADATLTYNTPTVDECSAIIANFTSAATPTSASTSTDDHVPGFKAGAVCAGGVLTLVLE